MALGIFKRIEDLVEQFDRLATAAQSRQPPLPERNHLDQNVLALRRQATQPEQEPPQRRTVITVRRGQKLLQQVP